MQPCGVIWQKNVISRSSDQYAANLCTNFNCSLGLGFGDGLGLRPCYGPLFLSRRARRKKGTMTWAQLGPMVKFGTSSAFRGWVRVRVLGYGFGVKGKKSKVT